MIVDRKTQPDGMMSFLGGQDSSLQPHMLRPDQSSELWNCIVRGGKLGPRPGFDKIELTFPTEEIEDWFSTQQSQGAIVFITRARRAIQVWSVGGRFFTVDVENNGAVMEITPTMTTTTTANFTVPAVGSSVSVQVADPDLIRAGYPVKINGKTYNITAKSGSTLTAVNVDDTPGNIVSTSNQSTVTVAFVMPAESATVVATVSDTSWMVVNQVVSVSTPDGSVRALMRVTVIGGPTSVTLLNLPGIGNSTSGTVVVDSTIRTSAASVVYLDPNSPNTGIAYMIQAEDFLIAQDGLSKAFIFDGGNSRRADTAKNEVPTGTVMAYGIGRLWVAIGSPGSDGSFVASDIVYGPSGTSAYGKRDAILKFTENTFLAGGGAFNVPGMITAMAFASSLDTSTGQGPLMVFTEVAVCSVDAPSERELWAVVRNPIQSISLLANGANSFYGTIPTVNGDIFYRARDGMRSFILARREFGTWGNVPISGEMDNVMSSDAPKLLKYHSAIVFENRLLFTAASRPTRFGAYWKGIVSLDFDPLSTIGTKSPPVFDGTWTGVDPVWLFSGIYGRDERAFMVVRNEDGGNELWEISKGHQFDNGDGRIVWTMISRGFYFKSPLEMLRLENLELFPVNVIGDMDITVSYHSDAYPCWFPWKAQPTCANYRRCESWENCETPIAFRGGYRTRLPFGQPPDTDETNDGRPARLGYVHQLKIQFEGYAEITKLRVIAKEVDEEPAPPVDQTETCQEINCCPDDFFAWRSVNATEPGGESTT